jgi:hypothetical protein
MDAYAPIRIPKGAKPTLFQKACGYTLLDETVITSASGERCLVRHTVFVPPDVRACVLWFAPQRRAEWRFLDGDRR